MKAITRTIAKHLSLKFGVSLMLLLAAGAVFAQSDDEAEPFSQAQLDQMLAPVALYPDTVLSHLLIAATYPLEVVMAERWTRENPDLEGQEAVEAVEDEDWDPSVKALVAFPDLLRRMSEDLDWTENLGEAFLTDEEQVVDSVQDLRQRAYDQGKLEDLEHLTVSRDEERQIIIEPVVKEVVYIPYYDTRVVYGPWWWADHQPRYWHDRHHSHWVHWGPRVRISGHFFFSSFHWDHRRVVVIDRSYRYRQPLYRSRYIARHEHARHWQHNPYHRRGVQYRSPRTRDFFERKHRARDGGSYQRSVRGDSKPAQLERRSSQSAIKRELSRDRDRGTPTRESRLNRVSPDKSLRKSESGGAQARRSADKTKALIEQRSKRDKQDTQARRAKQDIQARARGQQESAKQGTQTLDRARQSQLRERSTQQRVQPSASRSSSNNAARELRGRESSAKVQRRESRPQPKTRATRPQGQSNARPSRQSGATKRSHLKNERQR